MAKSIFNKPSKKKKKRNPVLDYLAYLALRLLVCFVCLFSIKQNLKTARFLGRLLWKHYKRGRKRALDNLRASYPEKDDQWHNDIGKRSFQHLVMMAMDVLYTPKLVKKENWRMNSRFVTAEHAKWMMKEDQ